MFEPQQIAENVTLRALRSEDARALTDAYVRNRAYLEQWEPTRADDFCTEETQSLDISRRIEMEQAGVGYSLGLFTEGALIGRFNLAEVVRGVFQSAGIGYWVDQTHAGRGLASAAVKAMLSNARDHLGLHRLEAATLVHNVGSQRVLARAGFKQIGMAPRYLKIVGEWQDHNLYQAILHS